MRNKKVSTVLSWIMCSVLLAACSDDPPKSNNSVVVSEGNNSQLAKEKEAAKSDEEKNVEMATKALQTVVEITSHTIKQLKVNDSIKLAQREKMFAYQIGLPIRHEADLFEEYKKLSDVTDIYVLKKSRKEHYLIKYSAKAEKELNDSLEIFKAGLPEDLVAGVKVINLSQLCSKREKLMKGESLSKRKEEIELPCLICE